MVAVEVQPFAAVPVTVYVVDMAGDAVTFAPEEALNPDVGSQLYVVPPLAASGVDPEGQMFMDVGVTATVGEAFTVTVIVCVDVQLPLEPVIVYVVVTVGDAVTTAPVAALSPVAGAHEYVDAPLAVNVVDPPLQIVDEGDDASVTVGVAAVETTITVEVELHPNELQACSVTL